MTKLSLIKKTSADGLNVRCRPVYVVVHGGEEDRLGKGFNVSCCTAGSGSDSWM